MANSVDPVQTAPMGAICSGSTLFASILNSSVMLGNYLQQTTSADDIFRCIFFLGALRVKTKPLQNGNISYTIYFLFYRRPLLRGVRHNDNIIWRGIRLFIESVRRNTCLPVRLDIHRRH